MLPTLLNLPATPADFAQWSFANQDAHTRIIASIHKNNNNIVLVNRVLDPIPTNDVKGWLWSHQLTHNDMNGALGIAGADLTDVDFRDKAQFSEWMRLHFNEHFLAAQILQIN